MSWVIASAGMLAILPGQANAIPAVYEIQIIPFDDLVIPIYTPFQPEGTPYYADFNGDGIIDMFIQPSTSDGKSYIFLGRADGTYGIALQSWSKGYLGLDWGADRVNLYIDDFNGDGRADIIVESKANGATSAILSSDSRGQFVAAEYSWTQQYETAPPPAGKVPPGFNYSVRSSTQPKTITEYDGLGRPVKVTYPHGTFSTLGYNLWDVTNTDAKGNATTRSYDALNRLIKVVEPTGGGTTIYSYDSYTVMSINIQSIIDDAGNSQTTLFDTLGRKITYEDPDLGRLVYTYDANGNMLNQTDNKSQKLTFKYDALNRPKTKTYPDGKVITNYYDDPTAGTYRIGRLWKVTDLTGSTTLTYDQRGRQVKVSKVIGATTFTTQTSYDSLDRVVAMTYPDLEVVQNTYNAQGLVSKVHSNSYNLDYIASVNYNAFGQITSRTAGNGKVTTFDYYDSTGKGALNFRLRKISTPGMQDITFTNYDNVGNIVDITDALRAGTQHFEYDKLNRLTLASSGTAPSFSFGYSYNAIGNMQTVRGSTYSYNPWGYQPHAPVNDGLCNYGYDPNGNMINSTCGTAAKRSYTWDYDNKLASVYDATKTYGTYSYDYVGARVKKVDGTITTLSPFPHYRLNNGAVTKYYFANGERVAERTGGTAATNVYYYHSDHLGSANVVSNSAGAEVKATLFYPYGENRYSSGTKTLAFKYTGQEYDESTALHNYGARYYNANFMHFMSPDSIIPDVTNPQTFNRYAYVYNNPVKYIDPNGHAARTVEKGVVLTLWIRDHWNEAQRIAAAWKAGKLDDAATNGLLVKTPSVSSPNANRIFEQNGGVREAGKDLDHTLDKQAGGAPFDPTNMGNLDKSVNRSFGKQIADQLRDVPYGTPITAVILMMSDVANAASEITPGDVGSFLFDISPASDIYDAFKIEALGGGTDMINWDSPPPILYQLHDYNQSNYPEEDY